MALCFGFFWRKILIQFVLSYFLHFLSVGSDYNNLCFKFGFGILLRSCFTFLVSLKSYSLARQLLLLDLTCFCVVFKEPAGIACYAFEAFTRGCILLD